MTLREAIVMQSIFRCETVVEISKIISIQPDPTIFFKTFFEMDWANLVQIFSFESRLVVSLMK